MLGRVRKDIQERHLLEDDMKMHLDINTYTDTDRLLQDDTVQ